MPYTLKQYIDLEQDPLNKYILTNLLREIKVMDVLPFHDIDSLRTTAIRWKSLPQVAFRNINSDYTEDTAGDVEEVWESLYILGGLVKFDNIFDKVKNTITDPKRMVMDMKLKAISFKFNDYFINGDLGTDPLGFEGLKKRVGLMPSRQTVLATASGATALDVTASAANVNLFWTKMERAYRFCNNDQVDAMFCNEDMLLGFGRSLRYINSAGGNFLDVTQDSFDRAVMTYKGTPVYDLGLKQDQSTEIIPDTETAADAGSDATSIYLASFNEQEGIVGIQLGPLETKEDAKRDVATANQTLIEWVLGLAQFGSYGLVRLTNILAPDTWTA